jgi:hypothetical protein
LYVPEGESYPCNVNDHHNNNNNKMLTMYKMHHPRADRQAICKEERGRERTGTGRSGI